MVNFWNQNKILICVFAFLTAVTVYGLFDQSEEEQKELTAKVSAELVKNAKTIVSRQPASVDNSKPTKNSVKVKLFCGPSAMKLNFGKSLLMLEVSTCQKLFGKHQLWVRNKSNGFKAQVFKTSDQNFKTDFLQLNKGSNIIEVEGILKDGQKITQTLEIQSGL